MNASKRITLTVVAIFSAVFCVLAIVMFYQARADIQQEESAAMKVAKVLADSKLSVDTIHAIVENNRGIRLASEARPATGFIQQNLAPFFFIEPATTTITAHNGESIIVEANNQPEINEIIDTVLNVFFIYLIALAITLFTLRYAINSRLKPLAELCEGLRSLNAGDLKLAEMSTDIAEIHTLIKHYNNLISGLSVKETLVSNLRKRLSALQENERRLLARELHDNLGQLITSITVQSYMLKQQKNNPEYIVKACENISSQCHSVHQGMKEITQQLYPVFLNKLGLISALQQMTQSWQDIHQIDVVWRSVKHQIEPDLHRDTQIYRCIQEALNNIAKHANATEVVITIHLFDDELSFSVEDNGVGFEVTQQQQGLGLVSMHERAQLVGGKMKIDSNSNGTRVVLHVPCKSPEENFDEYTHS